MSVPLAVPLLVLMMHRPFALFWWARFSLVQIATPDAMRGRVGAVNSLFTGTSNTLGDFESGVTAAWFGAVPAVLIGGLGTVLAALLWMRLFPQLARIDRLESAS